MKRLAKRRMRIVRKDAENTYDVKSLAKRRLQKAHIAQQSQFSVERIAKKFVADFANSANLGRFL